MTAKYRITDDATGEVILGEHWEVTAMVNGSYFEHRHYTDFEDVLKYLRTVQQMAYTGDSNGREIKLNKRFAI